MSTEAADISFRPLLRYALGSTLLMALAMGIGWDLAFLTPVLALGFFAPGSTMPSFKEGLAFVATIAVTTLTGFIFTKLFLDYILLFILLLGLALLTIFYTDKLGPKPKVFMLISLLLIPMLGLQNLAISLVFTKMFIGGAAITMVLVWVIYSLFPDKPADHAPATGKAAGEGPSAQARFSYAVDTLLIVFPVVLVFFFFQWTGGLIILIFITILSMQPSFNYKAGMAMIIGNLLGGIFAIVAYELVVMVPFYPYFVLMVLAVSLFFASKLFSKSPKAPLFGMGFSTFLLITGQSISSTDDAGGKVWMRVLMIMIAVIYVVTAFRILEAYKEKKKRNLQRSLS
jgi:hypothetical protein